MGVQVEQLLLGPMRPKQLALLMTARAQAPELAGEGDQELMAAIGTAHPGDAVVDDAPVEVAVECRLHTAAQVAVGRLEALFAGEKEALGVVGQGPVEDRPLGMARAIDLDTRWRLRPSPPRRGKTASRAVGGEPRQSR